METIDPKTARRFLEIAKLKQRSGAMSLSEEAAFQQSKLGAAICRLSPFLSPTEHIEALIVLREQIKADTILIVLDSLSQALEAGDNPRLWSLLFIDLLEEGDRKREPKRKALHALLSSKIALLIASEAGCFSQEEV